VYNLNYTATLRGYKVEDKLYLGVREQKKPINTTVVRYDQTKGYETDEALQRVWRTLETNILVFYNY
jgi:hypothetical protein